VDLAEGHLGGDGLGGGIEIVYVLAGCCERADELAVRIDAFDGGAALAGLGGCEGGLGRLDLGGRGSLGWVGDQALPRPVHRCVHHHTRESKMSARRVTWQYYDRRVSQGVPGIDNAVAYWTGLGLATTAEQVSAEASGVEKPLRALRPATFVEVGAGPGTFTGMLRGRGVVVDQSAAAVARLRLDHPAVPAVRADAAALPFRDRSFERYFAAHLYGLLEIDDRVLMLQEARRVAAGVVILDAGRPEGVRAEEWQERSLPDGSRYRIYRRHFEPEVLASEIDGEVLFAGSFYVLAASRSASIDAGLVHRASAATSPAARSARPVSVSHPARARSTMVRSWRPSRARTPPQAGRLPAGGPDPQCCR
jgi:hypothetical protein